MGFGYRLYPSYAGYAGFHVTSNGGHGGPTRGSGTGRFDVQRGGGVAPHGETSDARREDALRGTATPVDPRLERPGERRRPADATDENPRLGHRGNDR